MLSQWKLWVCCALLTLSFKVSRASPGDQLDEFDDCVDACAVAKHCPDAEAIEEDNPFKNDQFADLGLCYKLLLWDCNSDCDYQCQHVITNMRIQNGEEIYQFHGKWPFKRAFGTQEFYSTIFSIGNFVPHYKGFKLCRRALRKIPRSDQSRKMLVNYLLVSVAGMLAWTSSSIFHTRDLIITEKLDYFFAGFTVLTGFHAIFYRSMRLDLHRKTGSCFSVLVILIFLAHILRLYLDWSYTYNMRFNVFFGILQHMLLVALALLNFQRVRSLRSDLIHDLVLVPIGLVVFTSLAMSCELFDFFSYNFQIDSHAIWHCLTIFPSFYLYPFFLKDYIFLKSKTVVNIKEV